MMPQKGKKKKNNAVVVFIIVIALVALAVVAILLGRRLISTESRTVNIDMPLIVTPLTSSAGEEFNVQTLFTVIIDTEARREVTNDELAEALTDIMKNVDADKILGRDRVGYLHDNATEQLNSYLSHKGIKTRVLVVDISTDDRIKLTVPEGQSGEVMRELFPNMD